MKGLRFRQLRRTDLLSREELRTSSDTLITEGQYDNAFPQSVNSIDSSSRTLTVGNANFIQWSVLPGDIVKIVGGDPEGTYTVEAVLNGIQIRVVESIPPLGGGASELSIYFPSGDQLVGVDSSSLTILEGDTLLEVLQSANDAIEAGGIVQTFPDLSARDSTNQEVVYVGRANPSGSSEDDPVWQIYRQNIENTNEPREFAGSTTDFIHRWTERESLNYG